MVDELIANIPDNFDAELALFETQLRALRASAWPEAMIILGDRVLDDWLVPRDFAESLARVMAEYDPAGTLAFFLQLAARDETVPGLDAAVATAVARLGVDDVLAASRDCPAPLLPQFHAAVARATVAR